MNTPDLFTVTEAAAVLRIGRTTAYELARRDLATDGGEGLDVVRIGGQLRIPRVALERIAGGPITTPGADAGARERGPQARAADLPTLPRTQRAPTIPSPPDQLQLGS